MRTRFAPSPTGYIHIGNVRSAIYPYLLAKQSADGKFILRIEDTDRARYVEGATELIEDTLEWLGLNWDEGPLVGGPHAPYFQSERKPIYHLWAKKLIAAGRAYADPTDAKTIDNYRKVCYNEKRPYLYRDFRPENPPEWHEGIPLRFKSDPKPRKWHDEVMGDLEAGPEVQDDIILIKADGMPTYNFAHIVDDAEMDINYICRGVEYLSSVPNYLALYEALDLPVPKFVSSHIFSVPPAVKNSANATAPNPSPNTAMTVSFPKPCLIISLASVGMTAANKKSTPKTSSSRVFRSTVSKLPAPAMTRPNCSG